MSWCDCYTIGNKLGADPDCPIHGKKAVTERDQTEQLIALYEQRIKDYDDLLKNALEQIDMRDVTIHSLLQHSADLTRLVAHQNRLIEDLEDLLKHRNSVH